jgi:hypothetical protein
MDKWLAGPDPPSKKGIKTGGPKPDLMWHYRGSCRQAAVVRGLYRIVQSTAIGKRTEFTLCIPHR